MAFTADQVLVRDSKDPDGGALAFSRDEWSAFVAGVKAGEFDDPLGGADDRDFGLPAN